MQYKFTYRRRLFWRSLFVIGHVYIAEQDKMALFFADGSVREIAHWRDCSVRLGADWVSAQRKSLEQQSGQTIPLNVAGAK